MTRPPTTVIASLAAIAIAGIVFAITTALGGAPVVGALFLTLPLAAAASARVVRLSRPALFAVSLLAQAPLAVGVMLTWPQVSGMLPYVAGMLTITGGLAGMLTPAARAWYASVSAHRDIGID